MQLTERLPDKERFLAALQRRPTREVPYFETEFSPAICSQILGKSIGCRSYHMEVSDYVELLRRVGVDMASLCPIWDVGRQPITDAKGNPAYINGLIRDFEDIRKMQPPDLDAICSRIEDFLKAAENTGIGWVFALPGPSAAMRAIGYEEYFIKMLEEPEFVLEFLSRSEGYVLELAERVISYCPDAVRIGSNLCSKTGMVMSMAHAEHFELSWISRLLAPFHTAGIPAIVHSDGDNSMLFDRWIELGFAAIHPNEPTADTDIYTLKQAYGKRITLCGNIDVTGVLTRGSPADVRADTLEHLVRLAPGGGYICGSSHDISAEVPLPNLAAMVQTVSEFVNDTSGQ